MRSIGLFAFGAKQASPVMADTFAQRRNAVYGRRHGKLKGVPVGYCQLRGSARKGLRPTLAHCAGQVKHHGNVESINITSLDR
ncbi:MAG: hypothetical protein E2O35_03280 [Proteobacteria bacterium]|nr:MAG: hypothetical protein E2O35_03280 [Pseudomonadota bacterium]